MTTAAGAVGGKNRGMFAFDAAARLGSAAGLVLVSALACTGHVDLFGEGGDSPSSTGAGTPGAGTSAGAASSAGGSSSMGASGGSLVTAGQGGSTSSGTGGSSGSSAAAGAGGTVETCSFPEWSADEIYVIGDKVMYQGGAYIAEHGGDDVNVNQSLDPLISSWWWEPYVCVSGTGGSSGSGGSAGSSSSGGTGSSGDCAIDGILGEAKFNELFGVECGGHVVSYSYQSLCTALDTAGFSGFASSGDTAKDKRELAAFFAHAAKETWFLHYTTQSGCSSGTECGRGPLQLTGYSNYADAGDFLGLALATSPELVASDPVVGWKTALWYWMVHSNPGAGSPGVPHEAMNQNDFGQTTRIINGGIECGAVNDSACKRIELYTRFCVSMGLTESQCTSGVTLTCWSGASCGAVPGDCG